MTTAQLDPVEILKKDLREAAATMSAQEARYLVDYYYLQQENRKAVDNQIRSMAAEPHETLAWVTTQAHSLEASIQRALHAYSQGHTVGLWAESQVGIGPVISAGLLAHIDIEKAPYAGHIWNFAGLNPGIKWLGREGAKKLMVEIQALPLAPDRMEDDEEDPYALTPEEVELYMDMVTQPTGKQELTSYQVSAVAKLTNRKFGNLLRLARTEAGQVTPTSMTALLAKRPWNAKLKTLCWKIGESFVKSSNHPGCYYGALWRERKDLEERRNAVGEFAEQAKAKLENFRIGKGTEAYKWYSQGKLPPAHIHARAKRWGVKIFLSHWHQVAYEVQYGVKPSAPYAIAYLGHAHLLEPPNWPMKVE